MVQQRVHYSVEELRAAVERALCLSDVCKLLNITVCSFNYDRIRKLSVENGITLTHFAPKSVTGRRGKHVWTADMVLTDSSTISRGQLRSVLVRLGFYPGKCEICGISEWNHKPITIELDHINGINNDNRLENLRWLCPNCHSQTETFRNSRVRKRSQE